MDSIDPNSGVTPSGVSSSSAENTSGVSSQDEVTPGFDAENTSSTTEASGDQGVDVAMEQPAGVTAQQADLLQRSFDAKLDSFRAAVHEFNSRFNAQDIDINDTQSLILLFKGMLSDTQAMVSASSIDQNFSNRSLAQSRKKGVAEESLALKDTIRERNADIAEKRGQIDEKGGVLAEKILSKTLKEHQLANAQEMGDVDQATQLTLQITLLEHEIANLNYEVDNLNQDIQGYEAQNVLDGARAKKLSQSLNDTIEEFVSVLNLLGKVKQRFDPAALETGEDEREEGKVEAQLTESELNQRERKRINQKESVEQVDDEQIDRDARVEEGVRARATGDTQFLTTEDQQSLRQVFGARNEEEINQALTRIQERSGEFPPAEEGFAIALESGFVDRSQKKAETPAEEKQYGDNLSLEGATNPQIHSRIWREKDFAEGEETQAVKEAQLQEGEDRIEMQRQSVPEALQDFQNIPLEVAEMYEKQQEAARQISRNSRA